MTEEAYKRNKAKTLQWYYDHHEHSKARARAYYRNNKQRCLANHNAYMTERKKKDTSFRLACSLRARTTHAIKRGHKGGSAVRDLGCTLEEFKSYIESKWQFGMTWENWSQRGWHLDHIIPLCAFDLTDREQYLKAVHYTNIQPLWSRDNIAKGGNINN